MKRIENGRAFRQRFVAAASGRPLPEDPEVWHQAWSVVTVGGQ